jgi:hypothetical protein
VFKTIGPKETRQRNRDNLNNIRREAIRHSRSKRRKYLKDNINDLAANNKKKNTRDLYGDINEFEKCYQIRTNLIKDEIYDLLGDSHNILNRWKDYGTSQLL